MSSTLRRSAWGISRSKFLVSAAASVMLAACSAESDRWASNPSDSDPVYTASVPKHKAMPADDGGEDVVASKPLASAQTPPSYDYSKSYQSPRYKQPAVQSPQPEVAAAPTVPAGATVTVGPGMTLYSIARANNLSVAQLAAANGIRAPYSVHTGQTLRIPGGSGAATPRTAALAPRAAAPAAPFKQGPSVADAGSGSLHTVGNGETLFSLGRTFNVSPYAIADANGLPHDAQLALGQKVRIPGGTAAGTPVAARKAAAAPKLQTAAKSAPAAETETADAGTGATAPQPQQQQADASTKSSAGQVPDDQGQPQLADQAPIDGGASGLRWPVRGKVISGFGPKSNGLKNEGINIAVPEGTSVRAADSGVVAYAGNELKGYGNLILIRHDNGYVTAYAHAKELFVKRGDTVKRGDVIAKAGQTGSVSSPQLHFEVRKGATALDPMKYLSASTASN
jgi:murein DD-endopeptidase MepM/ murein hydrolase activator NlpD